MAKETQNAYEIDFSALRPEQVDEIVQSIHRRELRMLGMSEDDLQRLDQRLDVGQSYSAIELALLEAARAKVREKAESAEAHYHQTQLQRWEVFAGRVAPIAASGARPYWANGRRLYELANGASVPPPQYTVSSYCRWLHSLYARGGDSERARLYGKFVERSVAKSPKLRGHPDWEEIYHDPLNVKPTPERISALTIHGRPLWGAPDYVYRHRTTREVVIVERKASDAPIPDGGWPDLRAQLWCYAQIDKWRDAPSIRLVAEVWRYDHRGLTLRSAEGGVMRWMRNDANFQEENAELFALYQSLSERLPAATA